MENNINRRNLLSGTTTLPMLALPTLASAMTSPEAVLPLEASPDAAFISTVAHITVEIEEMHRLDKANMKEFRAAVAKYPPLPAVLKMTAKDAEMGLPTPRDSRHPGYFTTFHLSELKTFTGSKRVEVSRAQYQRVQTSLDTVVLYYPAKDAVVFSVPDPEAKARVAELKSAILKWEAACNRAVKKTGYVGNDSDVFWDNSHQRMLRLVGYQPKSIEGLTAKAELVWLMHIGDTDDGLPIGDSTDCQMISAIFDDFRRLAKAV